ncbi:ECF transporter S component [Virgibacillus necropolis]|uniref:ECF transporter S component n=1 Tax=Virgibacillus necropolis TaxID=163877 RepID=UPI00384C497D
MSTRKLSLLALFIALSVIGASIKIPAIVGSIALDAFPALLASVLLGKYQGAIIAGFGHVVSAFLAGMMLGPMHLIIALEMAIMVWCFSVIYQTGKKKFAGLFFILSNSFLAPLPMIFLFSEEFYYALLPPLFIGATFNTVLALVLIPRFKTIFSRRIVGNLK